MALDSTTPQLTTRQINQIQRTVALPSELPGGFLEVEIRLPNGSYQSAKLPPGILFQALAQQLPGPNNRKDIWKIVRCYDETTPEFYPGASTLTGLPAEFLCLGTICRVVFGPDGQNVDYIVAYDPTGPLQVYEDGRFTGGKAPGRWVVADSEQAATTGVETFSDITDRYARGKQVIALLPGSAYARLFELQPQDTDLPELLRSDFPNNRMPAPTGQPGDPYWVERPLAMPGYVGFQALGLALARSLVAPPSPGQDDLAQQRVTPARLYRILRYGEPANAFSRPPRAEFDVAVWGITPTSYGVQHACQIDNTTDQVVATGTYDLDTDTFTPGGVGGNDSRVTTLESPFVLYRPGAAPVAYASPAEAAEAAAALAPTTLCVLAIRQDFSGGLALTSPLEVDAPGVTLTGNLFVSGSATRATVRLNVNGQVIATNDATLDYAGTQTHTSEATSAVICSGGAALRYRGSVRFASANGSLSAVSAGGGAAARVDIDADITVANKGRILSSAGMRIVHRGRARSADQGVVLLNGSYDGYATLDTRGSGQPAVQVSQNADFGTGNHTLHAGAALLCDESVESIRNGNAQQMALVQHSGAFTASSAVGEQVTLVPLTLNSSPGPAGAAVQDFKVTLSQDGAQDIALPAGTTDLRNLLRIVEGADNQEAERDIDFTVSGTSLQLLAAGNWLAGDKVQADRYTSGVATGGTSAPAARLNLESIAASSITLSAADAEILTVDANGQLLRPELDYSVSRDNGVATIALLAAYSAVSLTVRYRPLSGSGGLVNLNGQGTGTPPTETVTITSVATTATTATVTATKSNTTKDLEYTRTGAPYQSSATFTGLTPGTAYTFTARLVGTTITDSETATTGAAGNLVLDPTDARIVRIGVWTDEVDAAYVSGKGAYSVQNRASDYFELTMPAGYTGLRMASLTTSSAGMLQVKVNGVNRTVFDQGSAATGTRTFPDITGLVAGDVVRFQKIDQGAAYIDQLTLLV